MAAAAVATHAYNRWPATAASRPIERLPVRRRGNNEPREVMNCKSCRKRKIKCDRLKPTCEACQVFDCACVYDAVPKKRGPKPDVFDSLVRRVTGLEQRLKDEQRPSAAERARKKAQSRHHAQEPDRKSFPAAPEHASPQTSPVESTRPPSLPLQPKMNPSPSLGQNQSQDAVAAILDVYFSRLHEKPYYILDETATRARLASGRLPRSLIYALNAVTVRFAVHISGGYAGAVAAGREWAARARAEIDVDEPSIDHLQALLLLSVAAFQAGRGRRSYMLLSHAVAMTLALDLHRELPDGLAVPPSEREGRRRLFWTCYLMDHFATTGSKRPPLASDEAICLRLPAWSGSGLQNWAEGIFFPNRSGQAMPSNLTGTPGSSGAVLVEITRILGTVNRYLALGGMKGDTHFPWHAQSLLSKVRAELDLWAASTQDRFLSLELLFSQPDCSALLLSKLIYHTAHCLLYRPFLPLDAADLPPRRRSSSSDAATLGQHQSWQAEAARSAFAHASAIIELVECARSAAVLDWPAFAAFCICSAGTVHAHGAHLFPDGGGSSSSSSSSPLDDRATASTSHLHSDGISNSASSSAAYLSCATAQLDALRFVWAGAEHQYRTLASVRAAHAQRAHGTGAFGSAPATSVFQLDSFFDRYPGRDLEAAHVSFVDVEPDVVAGPRWAGSHGGSYRDPTVSRGAAVDDDLPAAQDHAPCSPFPPFAADLASPTAAAVQPAPTSAPRAVDFRARPVASDSSASYPTPTTAGGGGPADSSADGFFLSSADWAPLSHSLSGSTQGLDEERRGADRDSGPDAMLWSNEGGLSPTSLAFGGGGGSGVAVDFEPRADEGRHDSFCGAGEGLSPDSDPFLSMLEELAASDEMVVTAGQIGLFPGETVGS